MSVRENHASCRETLREQRNARLVTRQRTASLSQPLRPNRWQCGHPGRKKQARCLRSQGFGGRGEMLGTLTQGGARGSCPSLALGYFLPPFTGLSREAAASCRCTSGKTSNLQVLAFASITPPHASRVFSVHLLFMSPCMARLTSGRAS